jgi:hypothetical protein
MVLGGGAFFVYSFILLLCWVGLHCGIYKCSYNISNLSYLNSSPSTILLYPPLPRGGAFRRLLEHEDKSFTSGISAFIKRGPREVPCSFHHVRTQQKDGRARTRMQILTSRACKWLDLGLSQPPQLSHFLLFINHLVCGNMLYHIYLNEASTYLLMIVTLVLYHDIMMLLFMMSFHWPFWLSFSLYFLTILFYSHLCFKIPFYRQYIFKQFNLRVLFGESMSFIFIFFKYLTMWFHVF